MATAGQICFILSLFAVVSVSFTQAAITDNAENIQLHHRMTKREIQTYFGADSHDKVPDYEVTTPFQSDNNGEFLSYKLHRSDSRHKRSTREPSLWYFNIKALGLNLHLNLTKASDVLHRKLVVETNHKNGTTTYSMPPQASHYQGHVVSEPGSMVAISNNEGLTGMINLLDQLLFVHPLPAHLAKDYGSPGGGHPHVVYRQSLDDATSKRTTCQMKESRSKRSVVDRRQRRSAGSNVLSPGHKQMEVALVADQYLTKNYGEDKIANYMLMIAHIVDRIFQDESIGDKKIHLVVVKLVINKDGLGYQKHDSLMTRLIKVSEWGVRNLPLKSGTRGHADVLVLITTGTSGGLAKASSTCTSQFGRTANSDIGLGTALIVAHEVAHSLGVNHDGGRVDCPDESFLMSSAVPGGKKALSWSPCSREQIQEFLSGSASSCLDDSPLDGGIVHQPAKFHNKLPGQVYDGNTQCEMQYGSKYFHCKQKLTDCGRLFCSHNGFECISYRAPPMDGTKCGVRHWCIKGECVDDGSPMIDGGWSEWSGYSECSKPCEGGVIWKSRTCTNPTPQGGGRHCEGSDKGFWRICNAKDCPKGSKSSRQKQCEVYDVRFKVHWLSDPCRLGCRHGALLHTMGRVTDGTRCRSDLTIKDVCIEGRCRSVGCDNVLQSGVKHDRCGMCGGDSSSCNIIKGEYTKDWRRWGPGNGDKIVDVPQGAANVLVKMKDKTSNLLGVQNSKGQYVYNVGYTWSTVVPAAGTKVAYDHEDYLYKDSVKITGPTKQPLKIIYVSLGRKNPGVTYKLFSPHKSQVTADNVYWNITRWSACSEPCAGGFKSRTVQCFRKDDGSWVKDELCNQTSNKPGSEQQCNTQPCQAEWYLSEWRPCSQTCGKGRHRRQVMCRRKVSMGTYSPPLPDEHCKGSTKPQGLMQRPCNLVDCPAEWVPSKWTKCSASCGPDGLTTRTLSCKKLNQNGAYVSVPSIHCKHAVKLSTQEQCNADIDCPNVIVTPNGKKFVPLGCYRDYSGFHALPKLVANLRSKINWYRMKKTVEECAEKVNQKNGTFKVFSVQFYGECWSGDNADATYAEYGSSKNCWKGVGGTHTNYVYTFV